MPHVAEGQLHAYLDRGPGDATASEWTAFESHLTQCEDCQGRLDEARRLRDRAQEILASVGPAHIDVPLFESLVARSVGAESGEASRESGGRRGWRSGNFPLAWAATIMVAVGAGWMARQVTISSNEFGSLATRPAAQVLSESADAPGEPAKTETAIAGQESLDRLEAKVDMDDEVAGRRANEVTNANAELPANRAAGLSNEADQRAAAKSVVVAEGEAEAGDRARRQAEAAAADPGALAEAERRDGADEEAAREPLPVTRDAVAQVEADNQRKVPETKVAVGGAIALQPFPANAVSAEGHAAPGCYALSVDWSQAGAAAARSGALAGAPAGAPAGTPALPARIELLAEAVTADPSGGDYFRDDGVVRAYELSADPGFAAAPAYWLPFGADSVLIRLEGEAGVTELRLQLIDGELSGVAQVLAPAEAGAPDAAHAPDAVEQGRVQGRAIDCDTTD